jgi:hypothetical protein
LIYGMIVTSIISYYLNSYYTRILIGYSIWDQVRDLSSSLIMAVFMGVAVYLSGLPPYPNIYTMLCVQIGIGIFVYALLCRLFGLEAFMELWESKRDKMLFWKTRSIG